MLDNLEWTCHICKEKRTDSRISVRQHPLIIGGREMGSQNVRYCNDKPDCIEQSKTFKFVKE